MQMIDRSQRPGRGARPESQRRASIGQRTYLAFSWLTAASISLVVLANILAVSSFRFPFFGPAVGFWFLVLQPAYLLYTSRLWRGCAPVEAVGYSVAFVLVLLMVAGLGINTVLPLVGIQRPLGPIPVVALADILTLSLFLLRLRYPRRFAWKGLLKGVGPKESRLLMLSAFSVALAVLGANRLNNNAGGTVSLAALAVTVAILLLLLRWQAQVGDVIISLTLYGVALCLLLMESLRGWYVSGHDIQVEYQVFQLTEAHAHWSIAYLRNAYNACLSITILPTEMSQVVHVDNPYIYKVFFQAIFALCPVLVYAIARRYWSRSISVLAVVYFIGCPIFFTDMPYLNRQEMAFVFVCIAILSITNIEWGLRRRRVTFLLAALGVELSHYSSMYFFLGILVVAWLAQLVLGVNLRGLLRRPGASTGNTKPWGSTVRTVGIWPISVVLAVTFAWGQLATQTAGSAVADVRSAVAGLVGSSGTRSADVSNFLISGKALTLSQTWSNYRQATFGQREASDTSSYVPAPVVDRYPARMTNELSSLPPTGIGYFLERIGISPEKVNTVVRSGAAKDEQLFVMIGFLTFLVMKRIRQHVGREVFCVAIGSMTMLVVIVVLPNLSVDYGVLRGFQEALIVAAPVLVAGSLTAFSPFGQKWALRISTAVCIGVFVSTTGLLPEVLGGYPAQLSLNNSGSYYSIYYTHPQEVAALGWLGSEPNVLSNGVQASYDPDRFLFTAPSDVNGSENITGIYPPLVKKSSWVIVGYSTLHTRQDTSYYDGDLISYVYPLGFLLNSKDLVYNNGGTEIFK